MLVKPLQQFAISRIAPNHIQRVGLKQILQCEPALVERQILGWHGRDPQEWILCRPVRIVLNLHHQRRHQIEILMDVGKLVQQLHHAVIVFERVQPRPRQTIFPRNQILIKRLVLMPKKNDAQGRHGWSSQSSMGILGNGLDGDSRLRLSAERSSAVFPVGSQNPEQHLS